LGEILVATRSFLGANDVAQRRNEDIYVTVLAGGRAEVALGPSGTFQITGASGPVQLTVDNQPAVPVSGTNTYAAWTFVGFTQPVDNLPVVNVVKAGAGVPLKWRILDDSGNPVTTLTTAKITTAALACSTGMTLDDIEETSTSAAVLQNLGNGYYSLVWKTSKDFAGLCKTLKLDLGEGTTRNAAFKFTR